VFDAATCKASRRDGCDQAPAHVALADDGSTADVAVGSTNTIYATNVGRRAVRGKTVYVIDGATCDATDISGCGARGRHALPTGPSDANPFGIAVEATNTIIRRTSPTASSPAASVIDGTTCNGRDDVRPDAGRLEPATLPPTDHPRRLHD
jgi:hypothetical protein